MFVSFRLCDNRLLFSFFCCTFGALSGVSVRWSLPADGQRCPAALFVSLLLVVVLGLQVVVLLLIPWLVSDVITTSVGKNQQAQCPGSLPPFSHLVLPQLYPLLIVFCCYFVKIPFVLCSYRSSIGCLVSSLRAIELRSPSALSIDRDVQIAVTICVINQS